MRCFFTIPSSLGSSFKILYFFDLDRKFAEVGPSLCPSPYSSNILIFNEAFSPNALIYIRRFLLMHLFSLSVFRDER